MGAYRAGRSGTALLSGDTDGRRGLDHAADEVFDRRDGAFGRRVGGIQGIGQVGTEPASLFHLDAATGQFEESEGAAHRQEGVGVVPQGGAIDDRREEPLTDLVLQVPEEFHQANMPEHAFEFHERRGIVDRERAGGISLRMQARRLVMSGGRIGGC